MEKIRKTNVISKEDAVFWLDGNGKWRNRHGPFEHKKIIDFFHSSIRKDGDGYYLYQSNGDCAEKVYFPYEDTALFVFDVLEENGEVLLVLNTGRKIELRPDDLYICKDFLYVRIDGETAKFSERALTKISDRIEFRQKKYRFQSGGKSHSIKQTSE